MANVVQIVLKALDQTKAGFTGPIKNLQDLEKRIDQVKPAIMTMAATAAAAFGAMTVHAINTADEMGKLAQKSGVTTEVFSSMAYAANQADLDSGKLVKTFKELSKNLDEAKDPVSKASQMFSQLGVNVRDSGGNMLAADQVLLQLADRFADSADDANKVAAATKIFGDKLGQDLIPFLNQGAAGIKELQQEAADLGQVFSGDTAKQAEEFKDNMTKLKSAMQGVANIVAAELLPTLVELTDGFVEWIKQTGAVRGMASTLVDLYRVADFAIESIVNSFRALWQAFETMGKIIGAFVSTWVDSWQLVIELAKSGGAVLWDVLTFNFEKAADTADAALDSIQQRFDQFKNGIIDAGTDAAGGFLKAFQTLSSGPTFPELNAFGGGSHGDGTAANPITIGKGSMPSISTSTGNAGSLLPSGFTMEAYQLEQDLLIKTQEIWTQAHGNRVTFAQQQAEQFELERMREEERFQNRMIQISNLQLAEGENFQLIEKAYMEHAGRMAKIDSDMVRSKRQAFMTMADSSASILGSMAATAQTFGKKGFAAYQAFSYAQAIVSTLTGASRAFADFPWPVSAVVSAAVLAAGMANVAQIASTKPPQAHAGATMIPEEATYLLKGGERVLAPEQNQDLTRFLSGNGGPSQVAVYLDGEILARGIGSLSRDGRLEISARAVV